jgi:hypothetical protein
MGNIDMGHEIGSGQGIGGRFLFFRYFYNFKVLFTINFTIFKLRSTAGQMPALVIVAA